MLTPSLLLSSCAMNFCSEVGRPLSISLLGQPFAFGNGSGNNSNSVISAVMILKVNVVVSRMSQVTRSKQSAYAVHRN